MSTNELIEKIKSLDANARNEIQKHVDDLVKKSLKENGKRIKAGFVKGTFTYISDDFDEPMELVDSKELERLRGIEMKMSKQKS